MRVLISGCGYVGAAVGAALTSNGHSVFGLRRSTSARPDLAQADIELLVADLTQPETLAALPSNYDQVVHCVAPASGGEEDYRRIYLDGSRNLLSWLAATPPRGFIYTSSTSVYGQTDGSVVTEESPTEPGTETGRILVAAEKLVRQEGTNLGIAPVILRLAGIYGPGRGYWLKQFLAGEARMEGKGERIMNLVHREDVTGAVVATLTALENGGHPGGCYNVVDDEPVTQLEFFQWLAARLGNALPPQAAEGDIAPRRRGVTHKRVSNARLKAELGYAFRYPTFRQGCEAELAKLTNPPGTKSS